MSIWISKKEKAYAGSPTTNWLKRYVEYLTKGMKETLEQGIADHCEGTAFPHSADAITFEGSGNVQDAIQKEIADRKDADQALTDTFTAKLEQEAESRSGSDEAILASVKKQVQIEKAERKAADESLSASLRDSIFAEAQARQAADDAFGTSLDAERQSRTEADISLSSSLQKMINTGLADKQALDFNVNIRIGKDASGKVTIWECSATVDEVFHAAFKEHRNVCLFYSDTLCPMCYSSYSTTGSILRFLYHSYRNDERDLLITAEKGQWHVAVVDQPSVPELIDKINEKVDAEDLLTFDKSVNLFDNSQWLEPGFISRTGSVGSTAYSHFYFPVDLSRTYTFPVYASYTGVANAPKIAVYNTNKVYIGMIAGVLSDNQSTVTVNLAENTVLDPSTGEEIDKTDVAYLCINIRPADLNTFMIVEGNTYPDIYYSYGQSRKIFLHPDIGLSRTFDNPLYNKKISLNGDSICYGSGYIGGFGKMIAENNLMKYQNIAVSGGTIMQDPENSDRHCISETIANMDEDADYIILEGGVNDASMNLALGTITEGYNADLDTATFAGAFEHMLKQAILRFPGKKIGYVFVHKMSERFLSTDEMGDTETHYTIAKKCCRKWGIPYIDLNAHSPISRYIPALRDAYTVPHPTLEQGDGWHPNKEGYQKFYVPQIESWMKTL